MSRTQQQAAALGVLLLVMAAVYARALRRPAASGPAPVQDVLGEVREIVPQDASGVLAKRAEQRTRGARLAWRRDPFLRGATAGGPAGLLLAGILWDATAPIAMINGQMLRVGEEVDGYRVTAIFHDHVSLTDGATAYDLSLE
jgi:hypothetical protein